MTGTPALPRSHRATRVARVLVAPLLLALAIAAQAPGSLVVRPGMSLWGLARASGTSVDALKALNHLSGDRILIGQVLRLPGTAAPGGASGLPVGVLGGPTTGIPASVLARAAADRAALSRAGTPGRAALTRLISAAAARAGVPASLALAVAYQESGINQRMVSNTDAVGVMQIERYTASWLSTSVLHRHLDPLSPTDNAAMGVALLRLLLNSADTRTAIAGYYQGLASVRAHGMYSDTRAYVASVMALRSRF